jgi:drug/metabolite transporter (DMT)-like permease
LPTWLYFLVPTVIWSTTFYAITLQLPHAPPVVSLCYRFALATLSMFALARKQPLRLPLALHLRLGVLGLVRYTCCYLMTYNAERFAPSVLASLAFSLLVFLNPIGGLIFFRKAIAGRTILGACLGCLGLLVIFGLSLGNDPHLLLGVELLVGATLASFVSDMLSISLSERNVGAPVITAWSLAYGTLGLLLVAVFTCTTFVVPHRASYWLSLLYLAVAGTAIAFSMYAELLKRVGPIAGYMSVVTPIGALALSIALEGLALTGTMAVGVLLAMLGAWFALEQPKQPPASVKQT